MNWIFTLVAPILFLVVQDAVCPPTSPVHVTAKSVSIDDFSLSAGPAAYFKGHGLSPAWRLSIAPDSISFVSEVPGYKLITVPHVDSDKKGDQKFYDIPMEEGRIQIFIGYESCTIDGSNESFAYSLSVVISTFTTTEPQTFNGCGRYVTNEKLTGRWILDEMNGKTVEDIEVDGNLPSVDIEPARNFFSGFAGCNKVSGRIFSEWSLLRFTDFVSTKMSCDQMEIEHEFLNALQFSTQFKVDDDRLVLSNPISTTLILKRD